MGQEQIIQLDCETKLRSLIQAIGHIVYEHDITGNHVKWMGDIESCVGYSAQELGDDECEWLNKIHPDDLTLAICSLDKAIKCLDKYDIRYRIKTKQDEYLWMHDRGTVVNIDGRTHIVGLIENINDRQIMAERHEIITESMALGYIEVSGGAQIIEVNKAYCELSGYTRDELLGMKIYDIEAVEKPDDIDNRIKSIGPSGIMRFDTKHRKKDGSKIDLEVCLTKIGSINKIYSLFHDVTDRKKRESKLQKANDELEQFVYSVSHDLKSPLVTIQGFTNLCKAAIDEGRSEDAIHDLDRIDKGSIKLKMVIDDLLELCRTGRLYNDWTSFRFKDLVDEVIEFQRENVNNAVKSNNLKLTVTDWPVIYAQRHSIMMALSNLLENAIKYGTKHTNNLIIRIDCDSVDDGWIIKVTDNGVGIPDEYKDKIFKAFVRVDSVSSGSGIGLAIVKKVADIHNGRAWVEDANPGSCFNLFINKVCNGKNL